jgi:6-phosphogluconolactonase (cycloisomerase 2 family)
VEISHDGRFLFTVNTASGSISRHSINRSGTLTLLGSTQVSSESGVGAVDARLSVDGENLYVDESRIGQVGEFAVNGGQLTQLGSVSLPVGAAAAGVAVK